MTAVVEQPTRIPTPPSRRLTIALVAVAVAPIVVIALQARFGLHGFIAIADNALNEVRVRDVFHHPVLLGPYSRTGWSHPGPAFYYLMWGPYRLFGADSQAMLVGAALFNGAAVATMVALARRAGTALLVTTALACALLAFRFPSSFLFDPWNPFLPVLPYGAFLYLAWSATDDNRWALPVAAAVGTFCMQTHIGFTPLVVPVVLGVAGWRFVAARRRHGRLDDTTRATLLWTLGVLAALWALPLIDQLTNDPGNLREAAYYFTVRDGDPQGFLRGYKVVAAQFGAGADWISGFKPPNPFSSEPVAVFGTPIPVLLAPFVAAAWWVGRAGPSRLRRLAVVLGSSVVLGWISVSRTLGVMSEYRLRWIWVLAALCTAFALAVAAREVARHAPAWMPRALTVVGVAATVALAAAACVHVAGAEPTGIRDVRRTKSLLRQVLADLPSGPGVIRMYPTDFRTTFLTTGMTLALERRGLPIKQRADFDSRLVWGSFRAYDGEPVRTRLYVVDGETYDGIIGMPGARVIAWSGRTDPEEVPALARELRRVAKQGFSERTFERLRELGRRLDVVGVVAVPPRRAASAS